MKNQLIILSVLLLTLFSACKKSSDDPKAPEIEFGGFNFLEKNAAGVDQRVELVVKFKDVNGDIGRRDNEKIDQCGKEYKDIFIYYEKFVNGNFSPFKLAVRDTILDVNCTVTVINDSTQLNYNRSLTYIQPEGNNKSIEGEVSYELNYASDLITLPAHGRFRIYMIDRAGNKSNEILTEDFIITK